MMRLSPGKHFLNLAVMQGVWTKTRQCVIRHLLYTRLSCKRFTYIVSRHLTTGIHSEKCVFRQFRHHVNMTEGTYPNLEGTAHYTPKPCGLAYCF